jgi:sodium-dependent dicarboxylate transporter 2/3/5
MKITRYLTVATTGLVLGILVFASLLVSPVPEVLIQFVAQNHPNASAEDVHQAALSMQKAFAVIALMVIWWLTEALPVAATAFVPAVFAPFLHLEKMEAGQLAPVPLPDILMNYADPVIFLFLGGFIIAAAMTYQGLDKRITYYLLSIPAFTRSPARLLLGVMLVSAVLSMWMNNTSSTAMLIPIGLGIIGGVRELSDSSDKQAFANFATCMVLGIAYSASIGGISTMVGSTPNGIAVSMLRQQGIAQLTFNEWLLFGLPVSVLILAFCWWYFTRFLPFGSLSFQNIREKVQAERAQLGVVKQGERRVFYIFLLTALTWMLIPFLRGVFPSGIDRFIRSMDVWVVAMAASIALFVVKESWRENKMLIPWDYAQSKIDWGALLLFGGGLAMSRMLVDTRCVDFVACSLTNALGDPGPLLLILVLTLFVNLLTEVSSNTAVSSMMIPIAISMAQQAGFSPVALTIAIAFGASMAFMMPVATPPNAIAYGTGLTPIPKMVRTGIWLNLVSTLLISLWVWLLSL